MGLRTRLFGRSFSVVWLIVATAALIGTVGTLFAFGASFFNAKFGLPLLALGAVIGSSVISAGADRETVHEMAWASAAAVVLIFLADALLPGLEFIKDAGTRSIEWMAIASVVTAAFANLGGRLGTRLRRESLFLRAVGQSFVLIGCSFIHLVFLGALDETAPRIVGEFFLVAALLLPTVAGMLFQLAHSKRLHGGVFAFAPLVPLVILFVLTGTDDGGVVTVFLTAAGLVSGGTWFGGVIGAYLMRPPKLKVPQARVQDD